MNEREKDDSPAVVRPFVMNDYEQLVALYQQSELYGGQFDENRDGFERLKSKILSDPDAIFVAIEDEQMVGTVSLIEDGRVAWLFRFCVAKNENEDAVAKQLYDQAIATLKSKGHHQVLVYTPVGDEHLNERYQTLGLTQGSDFTCFWQDID